MGATTYDFSTGSKDTSYQIYETGTKIRRHVVNIADIISAGYVPLIANSDVIKVMPIYAGELVKSLRVRIITKGTTSATATIGDTAGAATMIPSIALDGNADVVYPNSSVTPGTMFNNLTTPPYAPTGGKYYTAANYVQMTVAGADPKIGVYEFVMEYIPVGTFTKV